MLHQDLESKGMAVNFQLSLNLVEPAVQEE